MGRMEKSWDLLGPRPSRPQGIGAGGTPAIQSIEAFEPWDAESSPYKKQHVFQASTCRMIQLWCAVRNHSSPDVRALSPRVREDDEQEEHSTGPTGMAIDPKTAHDRRYGHAVGAVFQQVTAIPAWSPKWISTWMLNWIVWESGCKPRLAATGKQGRSSFPIDLRLPLVC